MDAPPTPLSPTAGWVVGLLCALAGMGPILIGLGVLRPAEADPDMAPPWVLICAGLMFVAAGLAIAVGYGLGGGIAPDGDLPAGAPLAIRSVSLALALAILGLMTTVFGWIAFAPGPRHFTTTVSLPFLPAAVTRWAGDDTFGRVIFGGATALMVAMWIVGAVVGVARLQRARKRN
jgi:hypothetical protein